MCATTHHQEAIYQIRCEKYFDCEEFLGKSIREACVTCGARLADGEMLAPSEISDSENQK
jgi:hypothetical protein